MSGCEQIAEALKNEVLPDADSPDFSERVAGMQELEATAKRAAEALKRAEADAAAEAASAAPKRPVQDDARLGPEESQAPSPAVPVPMESSTDEGPSKKQRAGTADDSLGGSVKKDDAVKKKDQRQQISRNSKGKR